MSLAPRLACPACGSTIPTDRARGRTRVECPSGRHEWRLDEVVVDDD